MSLSHQNGEIVIDIRDNGRGFQVDRAFPGHLGLHTMAERAERLGGRLEIVSEPGAGTRVRVRVPAPDPR